MADRIPSLIGSSLAVSVLPDGAGLVQHPVVVISASAKQFTFNHYMTADQAREFVASLSRAIKEMEA